MKLVEVPVARLAEVAGISIAFEVKSVMEIDGLRLTERAVETPYRKDYDALESPATWAKRFDVKNWGLIVAEEAGAWRGSAVIAARTPGCDMLEGRDDLAVLWDLRVAPEARERGVGAALFRAAEAWAMRKGCRELRVETQNVNVPACRFYERQGCRLEAVNRTAYPGLANEIKLLWGKRLGEGREQGLLSGGDPGTLQGPGREKSE